VPNDNAIGDDGPMTWCRVYRNRNRGTAAGGGEAV